MIDIGANLAHGSFDSDRGAVLERAWTAGLTAIVVTGSSAESSQRALQLAREYRGRLFATAGLHPHHASEWSDELAEKFERLGRNPEVVALGECGLDYFRDLSPREAQRKAFAEQLALAVKLKKPVFLHQRDAHADFLPMLREHRSQLMDVAVHCFTDTHSALEDCLALDCHIGITGWICDERRGAVLRDIARLIPDDRLLVETDAPYLLPHNAPDDLRQTAGRRNEPAFLPWVVKSLAQVRQQTEEHIAAVTAANARRFFRLEI